MTRLKNGYGRHKKNIQITTHNGHVVAKVGLTKKKATLISLCDIEILNKHSFYAHKRNDGQYVARSSVDGSYLHRLLMNPDCSQEVDHVDANPLNNTRANLRRCTTRQNNLAKQRPSIEGYHGIHKNKWGWYQAVDGEGRKHGKYQKAKDAALARDELMMENYYHNEPDEELHTYGFIYWNDEQEVFRIYPKKLTESEDFLFDETQEAQSHSFNILEENNWSC